MKAKEVEDFVRDVLSFEFPLWKDNHLLIAHQMANGISIAYMEKPRSTPNQTCFDLNIIDDILFVLFIQVVKNKRGRGYGRLLYRLVEWIGIRFECKEVRMTPSGWTSSGETRASYLERLGYELCPNGEVRKELKRAASNCFVSDFGTSPPSILDGQLVHSKKILEW